MGETILLTQEQAKEKHMSRMKELAIDQQEAEDSQKQIEEYEAEQQEAYYWHVIAEFYGMCKHFGTEKVAGDLAAFKKTVEKPEEKSRIFVAHP
jgi:hypothetical protein